MLRVTARHEAVQTTNLDCFVVPPRNDAKRQQNKTMKTIKTILILCVALCFATSCKKIVDMSLMQDTVLENTDIRQIVVDDAWQVTIVADSLTYVELEYSAYLSKHVKANLEGTKLEIGFTGRIFPVSNSVFRATVHTPYLEKVEASDAVQLQCNGAFAGQHIEIVLDDASQCNGIVFAGQSCAIQMDDASLMTGLKFVGDTCNAVLKSASQFIGEINAATQFDIKLEKSSRFVNKGGVTAKANIELHGASMMNVVETQVSEMQVELTGSSEATVWVETTLGGTVKGFSTLYYKGQPQKDIICEMGSSVKPL